MGSLGRLQARSGIDGLGEAVEEVKALGEERVLSQQPQALCLFPVTCAAGQLTGCLPLSDGFPWAFDQSWGQLSQVCFLASC